MRSLSETLAAIPRKAGRWTIAGLPEGADALILSELARTTGGRDILHVARDGQRLERLQDGLRFFAPEREIMVFPAWDCLPYDRMSPHPDIVAERLETLVRLATPKKPGAPARIVLASVGAALQKVPPRRLYAEAAVVLKKGQTVDAAWLTTFLTENGYGRSETVMEPGEFAIRGGLIDLFPPGTAEPLRIDLFGDVLEEIRSFDPMSQRSTGPREEVVLLPAGASWSRATRKARPAACSTSCTSTAPRRRCRCPTTPRSRACRRARSASRSGRSNMASCSMASKSSARRTSSAIACRGRPRSVARPNASSPRPRRCRKAISSCIANMASAVTKGW